MTAADKIAAARALIDPLTGHTPGPWEMSADHPQNACANVRANWTSIATLYGGDVGIPNPAEGDPWGPQPIRDANARLTAAAPTLRDTVAALADLADALAQENDKLREALDPNHTKADYIGEFKQSVYFGTDDDGDEIWQDVTISWDVTKQIMAAIRTRAALGDTP